MQSEQEKTNLLNREQILPSQPSLAPATSTSSSQQQETNTPSFNISQIHSVRIKKQLQFLKGYNYILKQSQQGTITIKVNNLWDESSSSIHDQSPSISISDTELTIELPKQYPFKQPKFTHSRSGALTIQQLIDVWSPKFKILQMIQLIKKRVQQKTQLNMILANNLLYRAVNGLDSVWFWVLIAVLVRVLVGLGGCSGMADWPNLGDFQAHRNWMSITVNKPIHKWYTETSQNPWWRIDYPPVAAYLSLILGQIYNKIEPESMLLQNGYQSPTLFSFMRTTVLLVDFIFLLPPLYLLALELSPVKNRNNSLFISLIICIFLKPDQILIDHGHFQYNCLILGLIMYSFYFMITQRRYLACFLYTIAINSKLMAVYYSLAFFAGLIGISWRKFGRNRKNKAFGQWIMYAGIVSLTTLVLWIPWLGSMQTFKSVLTAIFPVHRGLYQLKVPNFWCISDVILKYQNWLSKPTLTILCAFACLIFSLPSMLALMIKPTHKVLVIAFSCIAMTFFMFSYHVHQKSILLPLCIVPFVSQYLGGTIVIDLVIGGCVGMYHLLVEDGQKLQYFVLMIVYIGVSLAYYSAENTFIRIYHPNHSYLHAQNSTILQPIETSVSHQTNSSFIQKIHNIYIWGGLIILHLCHAYISPPKSLPYLWNLLFAFYSFVINAIFLIICNWNLWNEVQVIIRGAKKE